MMRNKRIKTSYRYMLRRVRIFFVTRNNKEILTFLFFVILSFLFWILQSMNEETEKMYSIPLTYTNVPNDIVLDDSIPHNIRVRIKDKGLILLRYSLNKRFSPIDVDFNMLSNNDNAYFVNEASLLSSIKKQLKLTSSVLNFTPQQIKLPYEILKNKKVPVILKGEIIPKIQTRITEKGIQLMPDSVEIFATDEIIDSLKYVYTDSIYLDGISETIVKEIGFEKIKGVTMMPPQVRLNIPIEEYTEKKINLSVSVDDSPDSISVRLFPSNVDVSFFVALSEFKSAVGDSFKIVVDYNDIQEGGIQKLPIKILNKPQHITNLRIQPDSVEFLLEMR